MDMSKIYLVVGIISVIRIICITSCIWVTWLILYLIAKSSALVNIIFIRWWTVLVMMSCSLWIYKTEVVILFLILVSEIIGTMFWPIREFS